MRRRLPHPSEILRELYLEPLGLTVTAAAEALGETRKTLSAILNERAGIRAEMAYQLASAFETSPAHSMSLQQDHELWRARCTSVGRVRRLVVV